jgi:4-amino-4-deoxy-L-arabinose transferase-like glycosyltransferase
VSIPLNILKTGDYNPHFFNYPSLFFYLLAVVYAGYFLLFASRGVLGHLDGLVLPEQVLANVVGRATMPSQFLVGRGMVVLTGVLTVILVYWVTQKACGRRAAVIAALLLCVSPTHIRNSHFIAPDVTMVLWVVASFVSAYAVWAKGRRSDYIISGVLAGLAISTKYNAYPLLVALLAAHALRRGEKLLNTNIVLGVLSSVAGFFAGTPYALLDLPGFLNGVAFELRHYGTLGDPGIEGQNALLWYASYLVRHEGLLPLLAAFGAASGLMARSAKTLLLLSFPAAYLLLTSFGAVKNDRTILVIIPFLCIVAAALVDRGLSAIESWLSERGTARTLSHLVVAAAVATMLLWPSWQSVHINLRFSQDDVRTTVTEWMEVSLPDGSRIVGEYYSPLLVDSKHHFRWVDRAVDQPIEWYRQNADYVVFVQNRYGGFYLDPSHYPAEIAAYDTMFTQFELVKEFQGGALGSPCAARVYRVTS